MQEEVEALRSMVKDLKAKVDRYEAALVEIAAGPLSPAPDGCLAEKAEDFETRAQAVAKTALLP
jgi:hypothetical protein